MKTLLNAIDENKKLKEFDGEEIDSIRPEAFKIQIMQIQKSF